MKASVLGFLFLFCQVSFANTLYSRISECTIDQTAKGKEFKVTINYNRSENQQEQFNAVRKKLFARINKELAHYPNGLIEQNVFFKSNFQPSQLTGTVTVKQVESCSGKTYKITEDNLQLLSTIINENKLPSIKFTTEHTFVPQIPEQIEQIALDGKITEDSIFGLSIGDSYHSAIEKLGRFTLVWPIDDSLKLTLIGRNHLFVFKNDVLAHYQYHSNLLPMSLANQLELEAMDFDILLASSNINIKDNLSDTLVSELQGSFSNVSFNSIHNDGVTSFKKLKSFSIGKPILINTTNSLACYNGDTAFEQFLSNKNHNLVYFVDVDNKSAMLSGCLQKFVLSASGKLKEIILLDEISKAQSNSQIVDLWVSNLKPWTFDNIKHGQSVDELLALGAKQEWQNLLLETTNWLATFDVYEDAVYTGKIIPLD